MLTDFGDERPVAAPAPTDQERIESAYNPGDDLLTAGETCGGCAFSGRRGGQPWCKERRFVIRLEDPACQQFETAKKGGG